MSLRQPHYSAATPLTQLQLLLVSSRAMVVSHVQFNIRISAHIQGTIPLWIQLFQLLEQMAGCNTVIQCVSAPHHLVEVLGSTMGTHFFGWLTNLLVEYYFRDYCFSHPCYCATEPIYPRCTTCVLQVMIIRISQSRYGQP